MIRIGIWLRQKRQTAGKSQLTTSMETYVSLDTIRNIEQEKIYPRMNHFEKLCRCFGVRPSDYYHNSENLLESSPEASQTQKSAASPTNKSSH